MKLLLKILFPVLVLVGSVFAAKTILENRPEPATRPQFPSVQAVDATTLSTSEYPVTIRTQGTVQATQSATLVAEVTGSVIELSNSFVVGGRFSKGDVLVQVDERDYTIALTQAEANLAQANAALQEETARGQLAQDDWDSLGRSSEPSAITLRLPQAAAARANRASAQAQVERAQLDLERTRIIAPFDGQVLEAEIDQGQFVSRGNRLGQIYAGSSFDVRLPLSSRQIAFLDLPSPGDASGSPLPAVELSALVGGVEHKWGGEVIRAEGVDTSTQQLNVIARVETKQDSNTPSLRIGQFVRANINGRVLKDVFVLPRNALREDREVLIVNGDSELERRAISVAWVDEQTAAVNDGLKEGDVLVTTPLSTVTNGTPVRATIDGKAPPPRRRGPRAGQGGQAGGGEGRGGVGQRGQGQNGQRGEGDGEGRAAGQRDQQNEGGDARAAGQQGDGNGERRTGGQRDQSSEGGGEQASESHGESQHSQDDSSTTGKVERPASAVNN